MKDDFKKKIIGLMCMLFLDGWFGFGIIMELFQCKDIS